MPDGDRLSQLQAARRAALDMAGANITYADLANALERQGFAPDIIVEVLSRIIADEVAALRKAARAGYYYAASMFGIAAVVGVATVVGGGSGWAVAGFGAAGGALGARGLFDRWKASAKEKLLRDFNPTSDGGHP
jgi:hypothetical protein